VDQEYRDFQVSVHGEIAKTLQRDQDVVRVAISMPWNNGPAGRTCQLAENDQAKLNPRKAVESEKLDLCRRFPVLDGEAGNLLEWRSAEARAEFQGWLPRVGRAPGSGGNGKIVHNRHLLRAAHEKCKHNQIPMPIPRITSHGSLGQSESGRTAVCALSPTSGNPKLETARLLC